MNINIEYHKLLSAIKSSDFRYEDPNRKNVFRKQIPDYKIVHEFNSGGFPVITTKRLYWKGALGEFLGFMRGYNTVSKLKTLGVNFWTKDAFNYYNRLNSNKRYKTLKEFNRAIEQGEIEGLLGNIYPTQMRKWAGKIDQIQSLVDEMIENPMKTKKLVTMWNPEEDPNTQALSPCHWSFEVTFRSSNEFYVKWHQASVDTFLGLPINIVYYSMMGKFLEGLTGHKCVGVIGDLSNIHIYEPHMDKVDLQLSNLVEKYESPKNFTFYNIEELGEKFRSGELDLDGVIDDLINNLDKHKMSEYKSYGKISAEMIPYDS